MRLDPKSFVHVVIESCIASSVGNGKSLKYAVVVAGNMASYKVTNNEDILYEGLSSEQAAEVFNAFEEKAAAEERARRAEAELQELQRGVAPAMLH